MNGIFRRATERYTLPFCMCPLSCIWTSSKSNNEKLGECLSSLGSSWIQVRTGSFTSYQQKSDQPFLHLTLLHIHDQYYKVALWTFSQRPPVPLVHRTSGRCHHCELTSKFLIRSLHSARHNPPPCFFVGWRPYKNDFKILGMQQTVCGVCRSKTRGKKNCPRWFFIVRNINHSKIGLKDWFKGTVL